MENYWTVNKPRSYIFCYTLKWTKKKIIINSSIPVRSRLNEFKFWMIDFLFFDCITSNTSILISVINIYLVTVGEFLSRRSSKNISHLFVFIIKSSSKCNSRKKCYFNIIRPWDYPESFGICFQLDRKSKTWFLTFVSVYVFWIEQDKIRISQFSPPKFRYFADQNGPKRGPDEN